MLTWGAVNIGRGEGAGRGGRGEGSALVGTIPLGLVVDTFAVEEFTHAHAHAMNIPLIAPTTADHTFSTISVQSYNYVLPASSCQSYPPNSGRAVLLKLVVKLRDGLGEEVEGGM